MTEIYAQHKDGRMLHYPCWNSRGEIVPSPKLTAAVSIDQDGKTFPEGSLCIRMPRSWKLQDGWTLVDEKPARKTRAPNIAYLNRLNRKTAVDNTALIRT